MSIPFAITLSASSLHPEWPREALRRSVRGGRKDDGPPCRRLGPARFSDGHAHGAHLREPPKWGAPMPPLGELPFNEGFAVDLGMPPSVVAESRKR